MFVAELRGGRERKREIFISRRFFKLFRFSLSLSLSLSICLSLSLARARALILSLSSRFPAVECRANPEGILCRSSAGDKHVNAIS
jgi:hypothetical protein